MLSASKLKTRYATFGFPHEAHLDEGALWPVAFALTELTATANTSPVISTAACSCICGMAHGPLCTPAKFRRLPSWSRDKGTEPTHLTPILLPAHRKARHRYRERQTAARIAG